MRDWSDDPDFRREEDPARPPTDPNRRRLMQLMLASLAMAGSGCRQGDRFGSPLLSRPVTGYAWAEGEPVVYATSLGLDGIGRGVLVETVNGRPVKIDGNPLHPASLGASDAYMQAELLSLYDPERSRSVSERGQSRTWRQARDMLAVLARDVAARRGEGLHILIGPVASPTVSDLFVELRNRLPEVRLYVHAPVDDEAAKAGAHLAFGRNIATVHHLRHADTIVSFGSDFLGHGPLQVRYGADFAARRARGRETGRLPRLIVAETTPGLTGARADQLLAMTPHEIERMARSIGAALGVMPDSVPGGNPVQASDVAAALRSAGPASLVLAGRDQPASVHAIAHAINSKLGAVGRTVHFLNPLLPQAPEFGSLAELSDRLDAGAVTHLIIADCNPVFTAAADLQIAMRISRAPFSLHLGFSEEETARVCSWHLPQPHALESWGDMVTFDGMISMQQPVTAPFVETLSPIELFTTLLGQPQDGMTALKEHWRKRWTAEFEQRWTNALESGVVEGSAAAPVAVELRQNWAASITGAERNLTAPSLLLHFAPDASIWDGRYAANPWLQELPKPITKQVWGNAALIAPETAARFNLEDGDVITITSAVGSLDAPVQRIRGQAPETITVSLGYGRSAAGVVGSEIGFDGYRLRLSSSPWALAATIAKTGRRQRLVTTQDHHSMEGRDIVKVVATNAAAGAEFESRPQEAMASLYPDYVHDGYAWGMTVDLDACIGCNACVVSCQAENNVPVVGAEEVAAGREMHWLRVDRYHSPDTTETLFQPVPCMQCENAPCEVVCPVNATVHSREGLNDMVYNRCIGTRTCSNNCPYKVRRFNWFDYSATPPGQVGAHLNPEVTVRSRGVMEKCTYCVQRISSARIISKIENRSIRDGEVRTACQQACPTSAIVFGDVNDPTTAVSLKKRDHRNYALLAELNTRPRTSYLARVRRRSGTTESE